MSKRKNLATKIAAFLALFGILAGVIGTGIAYIYDAYKNPNRYQNQNQEDLSEQINELLNKIGSGNTNNTGGLTGEVETGNIDNVTGNLDTETETGTIDKTEENNSGNINEQGN